MSKEQNKLITERVQRFAPNTRPEKSMEPGWDRHYDDEKGRGIQIPDNRDGLFLQELRNARIEN